MKIAKVLLIYTGGTIGMIEDAETGELKAFDFNHLSEQIPELSRLNVALSSFSFEEPIDSSDMNLEEWKLIARTIEKNYDQYDGFVVLHGSDTMAFTASALSFMLQGLQKPVILTGSQLPIGTIRTDGKENLITAIEIAAEKDENQEAIIKEVAIYFEYSLYRGNRTTKVSANLFEAFQSPNYPELAIAGVNINYNSASFYKTIEENLTVFTDFQTDVALLKIFPGMRVDLFASLFDFSKCKGIILETFGAGNAPHNKQFHNLITNYLAEGGIILNITQCASGSVEQGKYKSSSFLNKAGVINGLDLTTEAAITKLMYLLGAESDRNVVVEKLKENTVGELSH
ncbi:MAG: asparaginase [Lishizhenia sp.]